MSKKTKMARHERYNEATGNISDATGTSIFDPVLCELAYRWFSGKGAKVLDPFAGGSVRGIVAHKLGRKYTGVELRPEQVAANIEQSMELCKGDEPEWIQGDSLQVIPTLKGPFDFIFSCPPYGNLEVYSDLPEDISNFSYEEFHTAYRAIIKACVAKLANDSFACFVVGDFREKNGYYHNFVSHTIQAFEDAGMRLYNEGILVTAIGSLSIRCARPFEGSRKMGKTHQNVLVFCKGSPKKATEKCGNVEITFPEPQS